MLSVASDASVSWKAETSASLSPLPPSRSMAASTGRARVGEQRRVGRDRDDGVVVAPEQVEVAVLAQHLRVAFLLERRLELRLVAHLGEGEEGRIRSVRRHVEHADGRLRAEPGAQLRDRGRVVSRRVAHLLLDAGGEVRPAREAPGEREQLRPGGGGLVDVGVEEGDGRGREGLGGAPVGPGGAGDRGGLVRAAAAGEHEAHEGQSGAGRQGAAEERDPSRRHVRTL